MTLSSLDLKHFLIRSEFESHWLISIKNHFNKIQTTPALRDVIKTDDKSACFFTEITDNNTEFSAIDSEEMPAFPEEAVSLLLKILTVNQEQIMTYRLGLSRRGILSQPEIALMLGTTKENVTILERKAIEALAKFVKAEGINSKTDISDISEKVKAYQKKNLSL